MNSQPQTQPQATPSTEATLTLSVKRVRTHIRGGVKHTTSNEGPNGGGGNTF